jgi:PleD family two-component response regulator
MLINDLKPAIGFYERIRDPKNSLRKFNSPYYINHNKKIHMKTTDFNLFIVDDDTSMLMGLRNYLSKRFGKGMTISTFSSGHRALEKIDQDTNVVILDYNLKGENGNEILKSIKSINPRTEVIMLTSNEDVAVAIESFRKGATDYIIKGNDRAWKKISSLVLNIITYPVRVMVKEFGISKYIAIFILVFLVMGVGVYIVLKSGY